MLTRKGFIKPVAAGGATTYLATKGSFLMRAWAPQSIAPTTPSTNCHLSFDPGAGGGEYVWHCHNVDHKDNEMMRLDKITPNLDEQSRHYHIGIDY